jgi:Pyruvate/2-oxoacid:ferredoxin oxidoreductase gamma subunit
MKLTIKRNQADVKGFFGGHKGVNFSLSGQCEVSQDEKGLIEKYKIADYVLARYEKQGKGAEPIDLSITVNGIISGTTIQTGDIKTLLELEEAMKNGCANMKELLGVMASFGGEQVFQI